MAHPDLPSNVKAMTASSKMRWRHRYWHLVKNERFINNPSAADLVKALADIGWTARLTGEPGSGIDFLAMHRKMIGHVNHMLMSANDPNWPKVEGWSEIPKDDDDEDWPEPSIPGLDAPDSWPPEIAPTLNAISAARSAARKQRMFALETRFRDPDYLQRPETTLDALGHDVEITVHNWMHMRYAAMPPADGETEDVSNDWLGAPFSSHVNPYFWKLHGWIDDCIGYWERARGETADMSDAWQAPDHAPPWDELDMGTDTLSVAKSTPRGALFGDILAFEVPEEQISAAIARVIGQ